MAVDTVETLSSVPVSIAYFGASLLVFAIGAAVHAGIAPYPELRLVREGNSAAAVGFSGALLGLALPLASVVMHSDSLLDQLIWSAVAVGLQLVVVALLRRMIPQVNRHVVEGQVASGILLGALALAIGVLNAAAMAY